MCVRVCVRVCVCARVRACVLTCVACWCQGLCSCKASDQFSGHCDSLHLHNVLSAFAQRPICICARPICICTASYLHLHNVLSAFAQRPIYMHTLHCVFDFSSLTNRLRSQSAFRESFFFCLARADSAMSV